MKKKEKKINRLDKKNRPLFHNDCPHANRKIKKKADQMLSSLKKKHHHHREAIEIYE